MFLVALAASFVPTHALAFTVQTFSPTGTVRSPRQVRAVFSEALVPFGDPRGMEPFTIDCSVKGKGVWEDQRTWIYEFETELSAGEHCVFKAKSGLKSEKGDAWTGTDAFDFNTGGPAVKGTDPYESSTVEQKPAFLLQLDGPVDPASVEKNVYLLVKDMAERIPVKVLSNKLRDEMLKGSNRWRYEEYELGGTDEDDVPVNKKKKKPVRIAIESTRVLPADQKIQLVWGKGVASPKGMATTADQFLAFHTEPEFSAKFHCERENEDSACLPIGDMTVNFTAPIDRDAAANIKLKFGNTVLTPFDDQAKKDQGNVAQGRGRHRAHRGRQQSGENEVSFVQFKGPFPPHAKFRLELPKNLKDDRGRTLTNGASYPLAVSTAGYPPLAKFAAPFGILEASDPVLPVTVRGVEPKLAGSKLEGSVISVGAKDPAQLLHWISRLKEKHDDYIRYEGQNRIDTRKDSLLAGEAKKQKFELPKPNGGAAFEVVGIPLGGKGFHVVEIESRLLGKALVESKEPMFVSSGALVTNLAVHLKWGSENSLVWVTTLDKGEPVKNAHLRATDCNGNVVWEGKTDEMGTAVADSFPSQKKVATCGGRKYNDFAGGVVVVAEKDDDFSLVYSGWDSGIEDWRFHVSTGGDEEETMAHTVFDRTLLRAGQTVHMKHFLREGFLRGIRYKQGDMPKTLVIVSGNGKRIILPVKFDSSGTAETEWVIPKEAELGGYSVYLTLNDVKAAHGADGEEEGFRTYGPGVFSTGYFRVEEFRLPVMAGTMQWPKGALVGETKVNADLNVRYLAGGGAAGLSVKVRSRAERMEGTSFESFEGYQFANGGVKTGRFNRGENRNKEDRGEKTFPEQNLTLDQGGGGRITVSGIPQWDMPIRLNVEAEYHDPNGAVQAVSRSTTSYPAAALVGIQPDGWVSQQDKVKFKVAVANPEGKPLANHEVKVSWLTKESYSHRKRIVGGFYAYENFEEISEKGSACSGKTNEKGVLECEGKAPATGNLVLVAETTDAGKTSRAHHDVFVAGADDWWFGQENDDRIDLLPEKKAYEPGETARFQVRSPFRTATALVTIEREGVLERFLTKVEGKNPVIEVPVKGEYAPNVFISAFLVRGRVDDAKPTALVDLGRPAHKMGLAAIDVNWKAHRLNVAVSADREEYRVREKAKVKVKVERATDGKPAANGEVLLVAVDEALLELMPNNSWDLLRSMMGERSLRVRTSTAQSQVIGKRHFGLKALPPGGGGGASSARELFDTLLYWKARLKLDGRGEAEAEVPMNDSLSSFKLVAIASEEADRFGTGTHSVRTRQDLMLFSGVSPLARRGDKINPEVTVRNASDKAFTAKVSATRDGAKLGTRSVELAAGASKSVSWPVNVGAKETTASYEFEASAGDAHDKLKISQNVEPALRESLLQGTLERVEGKLTLPVEKPRNSLPDVGGVGVKLAPTLANNLSGVKRYMEEYPYGCLEQRTSKAVALRDERAWKMIAGTLPMYVDHQGYFKYFPDERYGSETLTSYVLAIANEAGYAVPEDALRKAVSALKGFVTGTDYYAGFVYPAADLAIRKLAAMETLSRYQSFDPKYLQLIQIQPDLWPMRAVLDWYNLLRREEKIPDREARLKEVEQILRAKVEWRGTVIGFKGGVSLWWLMNSMDEDANRFLLATATDDAWTSDIGRVVRGAIGRMQGGHWDLTTANAWGVLAMERFSERHEKEPVNGEATGSLAGLSSEKVKLSPDQPYVTMNFNWPAKKSELAVSYAGTGKPWAFLEARAAVRLAEPIFKGYRLKRTVTPVEQKVKGKWSAGDVYRVKLEFTAPADMVWVVLSDPIPAGASVLGTGLGGDSASLTRGEKSKGWSWGHEERSFSGFRDYFQWLPRGDHQVEYTVRLNGAGTFQLPNSRVEAMYAPEMYAEIPNEPVTVE